MRSLQCSIYIERDVTLECMMTRKLQGMLPNHPETIDDLKLLIELMASYAEGHAV